MKIVSSHMTLVRKFSTVFSNVSTDASSLEILLLDAGLKQDVIDIIKEGHVNINKVRQLDSK